MPSPTFLLSLSYCKRFENVKIYAVEEYIPEEESEKDLERKEKNNKWCVCFGGYRLKTNIGDIYIPATYPSYLVQFLLDNVDKIYGFYKEHYEKVEKTWIVLNKIDSESLKHKFLVISQKVNSRYFEDGRKRIKRKLKKLKLFKVRKKEIMLTLTFDPEKIRLDEAWLLLKKAFRNFMDRLNKERKRKIKVKNCVGYIAVVEQHKNGYPHIHIAFPGLKYLLNYKRLKELWGYGRVHVAQKRKKESVCSYICKYIAKLDGWTDLGLSFLYANRIRLYHVSQGLYKKLKEKIKEKKKEIEEKWNFVGVFVEDLESVKEYIWLFYGKPDELIVVSDSL